MRALVWAVLIAGCRFSREPALDLAIDAPDVVDEDADATVLPFDAAFGDVAHIGTGEEIQLTSQLALTINIPTMIDTTTGTVTPALPSGVVILPNEAQDTSGHRVMIIQANSIHFAAPVTITGDKPILFVANTTIFVQAPLDGSANSRVPGPGGHEPVAGPGAGVKGATGTSDAHSGGSGASFGGVGGPGGDCPGATGPPPRVAYGIPATLEGGSGGGDGKGKTCEPDGGGGGGAIQLTAGLSIQIAALVNVGGGGGDPGIQCDGDGASGAGGGSGGMIYLQSPMVFGNGVLAANGGGGGGGADVDGTPPGGVGGDANGVSPGSAGAGTAQGGAGGVGAAGTNVGGDGGDRSGTNENGGGAGGGTGLIFYSTTSKPSITASPDPIVL